MHKLVQLNFRKAWVTVLLSLAIVYTTMAQVVVVEDFNYVCCGNLVGQGGWLPYNAGTNPVQITPAGLTYPGYFGSGIGQAAQLAQVNGEDVGLAAPAAIGTGSIYMGFMINATTSSSAGIFMNFIGNGSAAVNTNSGFTFRNSAGNLQFGVQGAFSTNNYVFGQTYFIVLEYNSSLKTYSIYVNPTFFANKPPSTASFAHAGTAHTSISNIVIYQNNIGAAMVDGIRVGQSWSDIVGPAAGGGNTSESFAYTGGDDIGIHGWTNFLCCQTITVSGTAGLSYPRLNSSGNAAAIQNSGTGGYYLSTTSVSSGKIYARFLINSTISNPNTTNTQVGFYSAGAASQFNERQGFNLDNNLVSLKYGSNSGNIMNGPSIANGTTNLIVLAYDLGSNFYEVYHNPALGSTSPPGPTLTQPASQLPGSTIDGITLIRDGNLQGFIDEFAVSTNWSDVVALGEPPQAPTSFVAGTVSATSANFSFSNPSSVPDGYVVFRGTMIPPSSAPSDNTTYTPGQVVGDATVIASGSATSIVDLFVSAGSLYFYKIYPYYTSSGSTNYAQGIYLQGSLTTLSQEPASHAALFTATAVTPTQVNLSFSAASSIVNASGYVILRRQDGAFPTATGINDGAVVSPAPVTGTILVANISNPAQTTFSDAVVAGTQYNYAIIPYGYNGIDPASLNYRTVASIPITIATTLSLEPAAAPGTLNAAGLSSTQINVTFPAASTIPNASGYILLRRQDLSNPTGTGITDGVPPPVNPTAGTTLATTISSTAVTSFIDNPPSSGTQYNYALFPFGFNGSNPLTYNYLVTPVVTAIAFTLSTEPASHAGVFTATQAGTGQINLAFSAASTIANAAGYIILRRSDGANPTSTGILDGSASPGTPATGTTLITSITSTSTTTFSDMTVLPGIQYNYAIIPYGYNGVNAQTYNYRTLATIPTANAATLSLEPTAHAVSFTAVSSGTGTINLSFSAASTITNAAGYIILRRQDGANPTIANITDGAATAATPVAGTTLVTTINSTSTTGFADVVNAGTQYNYALIPFGWNGSNVATYNYRTAVTVPVANATTLSLEPLAHPALFTAAPAGTNQIDLAFSAASTITNATGYIILRRQDLSDPTNAGILDANVTGSIPAAGTTLITTISSTATTTFSDMTALPGIQYNYGIFAFGYNGSNPLTYNYLLTAGRTANATTLSLEPTAHAAVFTATSSGTGTINLSFSAASTLTNAAGYIILRRSDGSNPTATGITDGAATGGTPAAGTTLVATITNTATTTFPDAVSPGTQYNYALIPYGYNGTHALTYNYRTAATIPTANATTLSLEPLAHPVSFTAATGGTNQIDLTFSAASTITNAAGYIILRRQDLSNPAATGITDAAAAPTTPVAGTTLVATITNTGSTTFSDLTVAPGIQYNYAIFAYGYNGANALTYNYLLTAGKTANAFTLSNEPTAHAALFTATQFSTTQINLAFSAASTLTNAAGYIILRRADGVTPTAAGITDGTAAPSTPAVGTTLLTTITNTATTTFNDTGLSSGTQYTYALIPFGYNGAAAQTYNFRTAATIPTAGAFTLSLEPTGHSAIFTALQAGTSQINLAFSPANLITNAAGYIILRRQDGTNPTATGIIDGAPVPANPVIGTTLVTTITNTLTAAFNDTGLSSGIQYNYAIIPYGFNGTNPETNNFRTAATVPTANATTIVVEPSAQPTAINFTSVSATGFNVNFTAAAGGAAGYIAFRKTSSSPTTAIPVDGTTYTVGNTLGDGLIAYIGSAATFTETTLTASTSYFYDIFAFNGAGVSINYRTVSQLEGSQNTLAAAVGTQASSLIFSAVQNTQLTLSWTNGTGARRIIMARAGSAVNASPQNSTSYTANTIFGSGTQVGTGNFVVFDGTAGPVVVTGLTANTTYHFQVFDYNGTGIDNNFNVTTAANNPLSKLTLTNAPVANAAGNILQTSFDASWAAVTGATGGYFIDVSNDNFATTTGIYGNFAVAGTTINVTGLSGGSGYKFRVRAANATGSSANSAEIPVLLVPPNPVAITGTQLPLPAVGFTAKWGASNGAAEYRVDVATDNGFLSPVAGFTNVTVAGATSLDVSSLTPGASYFYRVRAKNNSGTSSDSNIINQLVAPATPANTTIPLATLGSTDFIVQWDVSAGATSYEVELLDESLAFISTTTVSTFFLNITGLTSETVYVVHVRAINAGGTSAFSGLQLTKTKKPDGTGGGGPTPPSISVTTPSSSASVKATIAAGTGSENTITYYHRKISENTFVVGSPILGNSLEASYDPAVDMDDIGMQYYFQAKDKYNRTDSTSPAFVYRPFSNKDVSTEANLAIGGTLESYRIFALPIKGNESIEDIFSPVIIHYGGYDKTKWRLVHYQSGRNVDFKEGLTKIEQGRGYWYNAKESIAINVTGTAVEANQSNGGFALRLDAGWTQIGNPYTFNINWTDILSKNGNPTGVGNLFVYDAANVSFKQVDVLSSWQGGFVKSDAAITLQIPVNVKQTTGRTKSSGIETARLDEPAWMLPLKLSQGKYYNEMGGIGMHPDAQYENDKFDQQTLPRFVKYLELSSYHERYFLHHFTRDVVPTTESYNWEYTVESNFDGDQAVLSWDRNSLGDNDAQLLLYDEAADLIVDMKQHSEYKFELAGKRTLKFMFSSDADHLLPAFNGLGRPYPNPFSSSLTIPFISGTSSPELEIVVYDAMGKRIRTLSQGRMEPGYHEIVWDGTDDQGGRAAQGLYIYRMTDGQGRSKQGRVIMR